MNNFEVQSEQSEKKYFTMLPNFVDDLDLSPYAFRLYVHLRRLAAGGSEIRSSVKRLASKCNCSSGSIQNAKQELIDNKLIVVKRKANENFVYHVIIIVDVWARNIKSFDTNRRSPDERIYSPSERHCSPDERHRSPDERHRSPDERYIEESKEEESKEEESKEEDSINTFSTEKIFNDEVQVNEEGIQKKIEGLQNQVLANERYLVPLLSRLKIPVADFKELAGVYANLRFEDPPESDDHLRKSFKHFLDNAKNLIKKDYQPKRGGPENGKKFEKFQYLND